MSLEQQFNHVAVEVATWPESMRRAAGFTDDSLTPEQRKEAAKRLRRRAEELDPQNREGSPAPTVAGNTWATIAAMTWTSQTHARPAAAAE